MLKRLNYLRWITQGMFLEKPREPEKAVARKEPSWSLSRWPPSALLSFPSVSLSAIRFHIYCIHWLLENNKIRPFILIFLSIADDNIVWWTMYYIWHDHHELNHNHDHRCIKSCFDFPCPCWQHHYLLIGNEANSVLNSSWTAFLLLPAFPVMSSYFQNHKHNSA